MAFWQVHESVPDKEPCATQSAVLAALNGPMGRCEVDRARLRATAVDMHRELVRQYVHQPQALYANYDGD